MIFDEPTNNLDLDSVKALSEALQAFDSAIVIVSHDVRFIQEVTGECYQITNVCSNTNSKASNTMIKSNSKGKNATKSSVTTTPCMNGGHGLKRLEGGVIEYQQSIQEYLKATS
jgi:ATPase subunit of ABC transporter with duplicated ATPase domains